MAYLLDADVFIRAKSRKATRPLPARLRSVEPKPGERYRTCVPLVPLQAAAGAFGDPQHVEDDGFEWVAVESRQRLRNTVKRYESEKVREGDSWRHAKITLKPVNPEFEPIVLTGADEQELQVVAELVEVLANEV